jgi:hypothetical protein
MGDGVRAAPKGRHRDSFTVATIEKAEQDVQSNNSRGAAEHIRVD